MPENRLAEADPFAIVLDRKHKLGAVASGVGAIGGDGRVTGARPLGGWAAVRRVVERVAHPFDQGVEQAYLDLCPKIRPLPFEESGQDAGERVHSGADVGSRYAGLVGR